MHTEAITPEKRLTLVPFQPTVTSSNLGWSSLRLEDYKNLPPSDLNLPPLNHHIVALHYKPPPGGLMHGCGETKKHCVLNKNDITYVPANVENLWEFDHGNPHCLHVLISEHFFNQTALTSLDIDPAAIESIGAIKTQDPRMQLLAKLLHSELYNKTQVGSLYIEGIVTAFTMLLLENHSNYSGRGTPQPPGSLGSRKLQIVQELMITNIETGLSLEVMANEVSLSSYHFARMFKASMGESPGHYFLLLRLEHAKHLLLKYPQRKIATIAQQCGFTDQAYLTRHFRRRFKITPAQLRTQYFR